jgi:hypothetical protein
MRPYTAHTEYLTPSQAGAYIGFTERALIEWRRRGIGPAYSRVGTRVRYSRSELDAYMRERMHTSTSTESVARDEGPQAA